MIRVIIIVFLLACFVSIAYPDKGQIVNEKIIRLNDSTLTEIKIVEPDEQQRLIDGQNQRISNLESEIANMKKRISDLEALVSE